MSILGLVTYYIGNTTLNAQSVGINTDGSSPTELLHIKGGKVLIEGSSDIMIDPNGTVGSGSIFGITIKAKSGAWNLGNYTHSTEGTSLGGFYLSGTGDVLSKYVIGKPGAEKITILSNGNLGIGNTNPGALLDIGTAGTQAGVIRLAGATSGNLTIQPSATTGTYTLTLPPSAGTANQVVQVDGSGNMNWVSPASSEISICEFLAYEFVNNRASGFVTFVVPATMNGRTITKVIARGSSGAGTTTVTLKKNGSNVTTISGVNSASAIQSAALSTILATGDLITVSTSATSGSLSGLTLTITVQ